jgi:hypothetical protein
VSGRENLSVCRLRRGNTQTIDVEGYLGVDLVKNIATDSDANNYWVIVMGCVIVTSSSASVCKASTNCQTTLKSAVEGAALRQTGKPCIAKELVQRAKDTDRIALEDLQGIRNGQRFEKANGDNTPGVLRLAIEDYHKVER